uniref:Uncharacterized protein n=1 Tax=Ciona intestinalis TaxID=7719 RepID=H2XWQ6_CIOIN
QRSFKSRRDTVIKLQIKWNYSCTIFPNPSILGNATSWQTEINYKFQNQRSVFTQTYNRPQVNYPIQIPIYDNTVFQIRFPITIKKATYIR